MAMSKAKESIPDFPILFSESNSPTGERTSSGTHSSFSFLLQNVLVDLTFHFLQSF